MCVVTSLDRPLCPLFRRLPRVHAQGAQGWLIAVAAREFNAFDIGLLLLFAPA